MSEHLLPAEKPVTESDEFIAAQLEGASIPTLLMSLIHLTGDTSLLRGTIRPKVVMMGGFQGDLSEADQASVRRMALKALADYRDRGCTLPPQPSPQLVQEMMNFMVGERVGDEYVPMMLEELALDGNDSRAPRWSHPVPAAVREQFHVLVIGAGMSGCCRRCASRRRASPSRWWRRTTRSGALGTRTITPAAVSTSPTISTPTRSSPTPGASTSRAVTSCWLLPRLRQTPRT